MINYVQVSGMASTIDEYKRLFREAHVSDQMKLFQIHIAIYLVVNIIWLALNMMGTLRLLLSGQYTTPQLDGVCW